MSKRRKHIPEILGLFVKLGLVAFGGPAAHIAMMQEEVVNKRRWMSRQHFLDLVGATNLIPGPNSTEMAIHCGMHRGGWSGLLIAGFGFILPAAFLTGVLAWFYVTYQSLPELGGFLFGIKPAVIAIILSAVYQLGKKALKNWQLGILGTAVAGASLYGINEVLAILAGGILGMIWLRSWKGNGTSSIHQCFVLSTTALTYLKKYSLLLPLNVLALARDISLLKLFLTFLKIGSVLFGSGYVLIAYLDGELVDSLGWLTKTQLLDAIAIGQFTPGPVLSTATFIGYQIAGIPGAVLATAGIFLPSFLFVALLNPLIPKLRQSPAAAAFLDAVNISAMGIMAAVTLKLGMDVLNDWRSWLIFVMSGAAVFGPRRINSAWIVIGGAITGYLLRLGATV